MPAETIKAISLWEPWASLVRTRAKQYETRSWATSYRGPLLICAAKGGLTRVELFSFLCRWDFQAGLGPLLGHLLDLKSAHWYDVQPRHLSFGKAVAIVNLVNCKPTGRMTLEEIGTDKTFGDFTPGRFAWQLDMLRNDFEPFPVSGKQRLFDVALPEGIRL